MLYILVLKVYYIHANNCFFIWNYSIMMYIKEQSLSSYVFICLFLISQIFCNCNLSISDPNSSSATHLVSNEIALATLPNGLGEGTMADVGDINNSNQMSKQNSGSYNNLFNVDSCTTETEVCSEAVTHDLKSLECGNIYSNIPSVDFMQGGDGKTDDASMHLYSNIPVASAVNEERNIGFNNDLDLDPVELTSNMAKVQVRKIAKESMHGTEFYKNNLNLKGTTKKDNGDDSKNSIINFENCNQTNAPNSNDTVLSASRLQLLQDTTMIDTALDLDSLDGSSIGNSSQVGLVKIVN